MRALLPNIYSLLGPLTLSLGLFSLVACTVDHKPAIEPPEINTHNAYINENDNSINFYSVNNDVLIQNKVASYSPAPSDFQNFLFLNTDESKQGYEYIAYVTTDSNNLSTINLLDLDKENTNNQYKLTTTNKYVCGLKSIQLPSTISYSHRQPSNIDRIDSPLIIVQTSVEETCTETLNFEQVVFSELIDADPDSFEGPEYQHSFISSEDANSLLILNYSSGVLLGSDYKGSYGYLSYDKDFSRVSFKYVEHDSNHEALESSWSTRLENEEPMLIKQVSAEHVLFQQGQNLYVISVHTLFTVDDLSFSSPSAPPQARIDALFSQPSLILDENQSTVVETNETQQLNSFGLRVENTLYNFIDGSFKEIYSLNESTDSASISFVLNSDNDALVLVRDEGEKDELVLVSSIGQASALMTADEISIQINNDIFYANTLNLIPNNAGYQAHIINRISNDYELQTFDDSALIHAHDMNNHYDLPLLISSNPEKNVQGTRQLSGTYLYKFDPNNKNGRALAQSTRLNNDQEEEYRDVDFSYGIFNSLQDIAVSEGTIINDQYGLLNINATTSVGGIKTESYFNYVFDPSQTTPDPELDSQSLSLLLVNGE